MKPHLFLALLYLRPLGSGSHSSGSSTTPQGRQADRSTREGVGRWCGRQTLMIPAGGECTKTGTWQSIPQVPPADPAH